MIIDSFVTTHHSTGAPVKVFKGVLVCAPSSRCAKKLIRNIESPEFPMVEMAYDWIKGQRELEAEKLMRIPLGKWQGKVLEYLYKVGPLNPVAYLKSDLRKARGYSYADAMDSMQKRGLVEYKEDHCFRGFGYWVITEKGREYQEALEIKKANMPVPKPESIMFVLD